MFFFLFFNPSNNFLQHVCKMAECFKFQRAPIRHESLIQRHTKALLGGAGKSNLLNILSQCSWQFI